MHQRFSLIANHLQQEMPARTDGQRPRFKITQPNLKCEDLKRKTPKSGGKSLDCSHVSSAGMNWEGPVHTKDQPSATGTLKDGGLILPRAVWEGFREELNFLAGSWPTDP